MHIQKDGHAFNPRMMSKTSNHTQQSIDNPSFAGEANDKYCVCCRDTTCNMHTQVLHQYALHKQNSMFVCADVQTLVATNAVTSSIVTEETSNIL